MRRAGCDARMRGRYTCLSHMSAGEGRGPSSPPNMRQEPRASSGFSAELHLPEVLRIVYRMRIARRYG